MNVPLHALLIEDSPDDALLVLRELGRHGYTVTSERVESAVALHAALARPGWDIVLSDFALPGFDGEAALRIVKDSALDLPFIFVSGTMGEDVAVAAMKAGAHDYVMKHNLARLGPAVSRELREAQERQQRRAAEAQLRISEHKYRHLFQEMSDAALLLSEPDGRIIDANERAGALFGLSRDELLGRPVGPLFPPLVSGTATAPWPGPDGAESSVRKPGGSTVPVHVTASRVTLDHRPLRLALFRDISLRKRAEDAVRASQQAFLSLVNTVDGIVWEADATDFRFLFVSAQAERILGYPVAQWLDHPDFWSAHLHPDDRDEAVRYCLTATKEGRDHQFQYRMIAADGRVVWVHDLVTVVMENDRPARLRGLMVDITDRHRAEEALRSSEERLSTVFHLSPTPICIVRAADDRIVDANEAFCAGTGYGLDELRGHTPTELRLWSDPAERAEIIRQMREKGSAIACMLHGRRKSGEIGVGLGSLARIVLNGEEHYLWLILDITERQRAEEALRASEQRFRQVTENIHEVFWLTDVHRREMIYISPAYACVFGRTCESLYAHPRQWFDAIHPDDRERIHSATLTLPQSEGYNLEYRIVRPDGTVRWIHDRAFPIRDGTGTVYRIAGVTADITAQHQLEDQLRQAQKMESLGTLAGGIAHDFNNILTGVLGSAEVARLELPEDHRAVPWLRNITQAGARARDLIEQIMTFGRKHESEMEPCRLQSVVAEALHLLRSTIPTMVQIDSRIDPACPPVIADDTQIHQVVMNLCTNAWHALPEQGGRIEVTLAPSMVAPEMTASRLGLKPGPHVLLTVRDNGRGMSPEVRSRIFEPFFTTKKQGQGTGLGLAVVHGIVQGHRGAIFVQSTLGVGTLFEVFLPAMTTAPAVSDLPPDQAYERGHGECILLIDDDATALAGLTAQLEHLGYRVTAFSDPRTAFMQFLATPGEFDLILTDYAMAEYSGQELAAKVLSVRPGMPIILASGLIDSRQIQRLRELGVREVVRKPVPLPELARALASNLRPKADVVNAGLRR